MSKNQITGTATQRNRNATANFVNLIMTSTVFCFQDGHSNFSSFIYSPCIYTLKLSNDQVHRYGRTDRQTDEGQSVKLVGDK